MSVKIYVKKPIEIEALKWDGGNHRSMYEFLEGKDKLINPSGDNFYIDFRKVDCGLVIKTSEGDMIANVGDYIIKEPFDKERGYYPCKPEIFEKTYDEIK